MVPIFSEGGLVAAVDHISTQKRFPLADFLLIWKLFCNRVKNHCVTSSPQSLEHFSMTGEELSKFLNLGNILTDRYSIGKMRDGYALRGLLQKSPNERTDVLTPMDPLRRGVSESTPPAR
jgi:hypothetical protein